MFEIDGSTTQASPIPASRPSAAPRSTLRTELVVARELERAVEARLVVARVVERARRRPVRHRVGGNEVAARESAGSSPSRPRGDRHRPLEAEVELRAAEAAVEPDGSVFVSTTRLRAATFRTR
jgi:hypothetical protein